MALSWRRLWNVPRSGHAYSSPGPASLAGGSGRIGGQGRRDASSRPEPELGPMESDHDRAVWTSLILLERFRAGDDDAATEIFARYFQRLTALARSRLSSRL